MLTSSQHSDLTIEVTGAGGDAAPVRFHAHAALLSQRSDVFRAALAHEMSESQSRVISIHDVPPLAVKALLHFLYTDAFEPVEAVLAEPEAAVDAAASAAGVPASSADEHGQEAPGMAPGTGGATCRVARLRALLAVAHMYQVVRLLRWCEQQLCVHLSCSTVCMLLELALLYEATELQSGCLELMQAHAPDVLKGPEFAAMSREALILYNMHCAGLKPVEATRKRKRGED